MAKAVPIEVRVSDLEPFKHLLAAAVAMVAEATVHPREWSSRHDLAIATAVRHLCPDLKPGWAGDPRYDGWDDPTDPGAQSDG